MSRLKDYYYMAKPGIVYGNWLTAAAGFFLASRGQIDLVTLVTMLAGIGLVMGSGCVFNNYIDRGIDSKMARTQKRAMVTGTISGQQALRYGAVLGLAGFAILASWTTLLAAVVAAVGWVVYVVFYGYAKRKSVHGTLVGSVAGAVPPVVGYTAVSGQMDAGAWILFGIMVLWQMPHFYSIAIYRMKDYAAAGIPVLSVKYGVKAAKWQILAYIAAYVVAAPWLWLAGYTGYVYAGVMLGIGAAWFVRALEGFSATDDVAWAKRMFGFSLWVLLIFSAMVAIDAVRV